MEHRKTEVFTGKCNGVPYEIRRWECGGEKIWNYYLFLIEEQMPDVFPSLWLDGKRMMINEKPTRHILYEYENTLIADLEWHCGCTYYEKVGGFDGAQRVLKVGCDYNHLWDEGKHYDLSDIEHDVIDCVNSLLDRVKVLQWCAYCGDYVGTVNEKNYCQKCENK